MRAKLQGHQIVIRELNSFDGRLRDAVSQALARGLQYTVGVSQRNYLRGPRPERLGVVTGRLLQSITSRVDAQSDRIVGAVGTNVPYGAFHEFGFNGSVSVRAHTRVISSVTGGGKPGAKTKPGVKNQKAGAVSFTTVKAHSRKLNYAGRPFLRTALDDAKPRILREINQAVAATLKGEA